MKINRIALLLSAAALAAAPGYANASSVGNSAVAGIADPSRTYGVSRLFRDDDGVHVDIVTSGLKANRPYTVWWVIFNNPDACGGVMQAFTEGQRCNEPDLANPNVAAGVMWATGGTTSANGIADFHAGLLEGDESGDRPFADFGLGNLLQDAEDAEIHLIIRLHQPAGAGGVSPLDQITTFELDCKQCEDVQFAVHP